MTNGLISPSDVPVVILAGGLGTRLMEETRTVPKPMVTVGELPIIMHIMKHYSHFGFKKFVICLGYKGYTIKEFFLNYAERTADITIKLNSKEGHVLSSKLEDDWEISLVETGEHSLTALRLWKARAYLENSSVFALTYGDGVSNIPLDQVLKFHCNHDKTGTVSAVHPPSRFGLLEFDSADGISAFREKEALINDYINGGFFFFDNRFLETLDQKNVALESDPLTNLAASGELSAYKHEGFWQCMDTMRDREYLESLYADGNAPWCY